MSALGDHRAALALNERAIEIRERLVHQEGRPELADSLAAGLHEQGQCGECSGGQPSGGGGE